MPVTVTFKYQAPTVETSDMVMNLRGKISQPIYPPSSRSQLHNLWIDDTWIDPDEGTGPCTTENEETSKKISICLHRRRNLGQRPSSRNNIATHIPIVTRSRPRKRRISTAFNRSFVSSPDVLFAPSGGSGGMSHLTSRLCFLERRLAAVSGGANLMVLPYYSRHNYVYSQSVVLW